jgi:hypothetical protein
VIASFVMSISVDHLVGEPADFVSIRVSCLTIDRTTRLVRRG